MHLNSHIAINFERRDQIITTILSIRDIDALNKVNRNWLIIRQTGEADALSKL